MRRALLQSYGICPGVGRDGSEQPLTSRSPSTQVALQCIFSDAMLECYPKLQAFGTNRLHAGSTLQPGGPRPIKCLVLSSTSIERPWRLLQSITLAEHIRQSYCLLPWVRVRCAHQFASKQSRLSISLPCTTMRTTMVPGAHVCAPGTIAHNVVSAFVV